MSVNLTRTGKGAKLSNVTQFMAESRENVENAVAGDIIGVYDTGTYQVGDTLTAVSYTHLDVYKRQVVFRSP